MRIQYCSYFKSIINQCIMNIKKMTAGLALILSLSWIYGQESVPPIKVIDKNSETTMVYDASSSSSSSCNSPDFPVIRGGSRKDINFNDLSWITVRHDKPASNDLYVTVELTTRDGEIEVMEMIKQIRFTGKTGEGEFSIPVREISMVQVMHPSY